MSASYLVLIVFHLFLAWFRRGSVSLVIPAASMSVWIEGIFDTKFAGRKLDATTIVEPDDEGPLNCVNPDADPEDDSVSFCLLGELWDDDGFPEKSDKRRAGERPDCLESVVTTFLASTKGGVMFPLTCLKVCLALRLVSLDLRIAPETMEEVMRTQHATENTRGVNMVVNEDWGEGGCGWCHSRGCDRGFDVIRWTLVNERK